MPPVQQPIPYGQPLVQYVYQQAPVLLYSMPQTTYVTQTVPIIQPSGPIQDNSEPIQIDSD
ncbi:CLUMA_CG011507, isoform A [Clunio marinus]|uniref:CLUMA_CG011507, isoform A n=1 Tax=Clunio marinus TaxID=568069 RepID=A0A1J1ID45_9DIPT|nr:CLUMA_CG011507, isoform A [Clunio marinus]